MSKSRLYKRFSVAGILAVLLVSALSRIVSAGLETLPQDGEAPVSPALERGALLCPPSEEVATLLTAIGERGVQLDDREVALARREQDVMVARQEIEGALQRLADAEDRLSARMAASTTAADSDINRLVRVYEGMKPKDAASLFESMDAGFAAGFLSRMNPDASAALFSNLSPEKAYALSVIMAGRNANAATE